MKNRLLAEVNCKRCEKSLFSKKMKTYYLFKEKIVVCPSCDASYLLMSNWKIEVFCFALTVTLSALSTYFYRDQKYFALSLTATLMMLSFFSWGALVKLEPKRR